MNFTESDFDHKIKGISKNNMFVSGINYTDTTFEINQLENEKLLLKQLIAQLRHENYLLRKRLFSTGKIEISKDKCA
jgi:hypothetical protein